MRLSQVFIEAIQYSVGVKAPRLYLHQMSNLTITQALMQVKEAYKGEPVTFAGGITLGKKKEN